MPGLVLRIQLPGQHLQVLACPIQSNSRFQLGDYGQEVYAALAPGRVALQGNPDVHAAGRAESKLLFAYDADHRVGGSVQRDGLADGVWIAAKLALPQIRADDRHGRRARLMFGGSEGPAQDRLDPQHREEILADQRGPHARGIVTADQVQVPYETSRHEV